MSEYFKPQLIERFLTISIQFIILDLRNLASPAAIKKRRQRLKMSQEKKDAQREKENLTNLVTKLQSEIDEVNTQKILLERNLNEEIFDLKSNHNAEILELQAKIAEMKSSIPTLLKRRSSQEQILCHNAPRT